MLPGLRGFLFSVGASGADSQGLKCTCASQDGQIGAADWSPWLNSKFSGGAFVLADGAAGQIQVVSVNVCGIFLDGVSCCEVCDISTTRFGTESVRCTLTFSNEGFL